MANDDDDIERRAIEIYKDNFFQLHVGTVAESWRLDREEMRERFRRMARAELAHE